MAELVIKGDNSKLKKFLKEFTVRFKRNGLEAQIKKEVKKSPSKRKPKEKE